MMTFFSLVKLLLLQILLGTALAFHSLSGQTIQELTSGFYTELQSDFGYPLSKAEAESLWLEAKEHHWTIMEKRPTELFPFLVCNSQPDSSTYDKLLSVLRLLEHAASTPGHLYTYFNPYSASRSDEKSSPYITKIAIEPILTRESLSCFLTSIDYNTAILASEDSESAHIVFNPLTPSMKMVQGTVDTLKYILEGRYSDIPSPSLLLRACPHVKSGYTKNVLAKDIATYLQTAKSISSIGLVTKSNFFYKTVTNQENALLPNRFTFWHENLVNGVENSSTQNCKSLLDRLLIAKGDTIHSFKLDANLIGASEVEKSCFWSTMAAIGEMSSICLLEINFPTGATMMN
jgi:hypothetical protein